MLRIVLSAVLALMAPMAISAQETENPLKSAKVGDWVKYKMTIQGLPNVTTMTQTVTAKEEKTVTLKTEIESNGMKFPGTETKIDVSQPFNLTNPAGAVPGAETKVTKLEDGKDSVKIGDKTYACSWIKNKIVAKAGGMTIESEIKVWTSKDVPVNGMVRMETKNSFSTTTMELVETGRGK